MDPRIDLLEHRVNSINEAHDEIKDVLKELTVAIHKLVIVDERQVQAALAMDRLSKEIDRVERKVDDNKRAADKSIERMGERIGPLELAAPQNRQAFGWVQGGVLALAVVTLQFVATKVGLK